jgi:hypothetical protein
LQRARETAEDVERVLEETRDTLAAGAVLDAQLMKARLAYSTAMMAERKASVDMLDIGKAALQSKVARAAAEAQLAAALKVADEMMALAKTAEGEAMAARRKADAALLAVVTPKA